jgi:diguanylate cyclase (GGDEF)-like protein
MRLSIQSRLLGAFGVVVALMLLIGLLAITRLGSEDAQLNRFASKVVPSTRIVGEIDATMNKYRNDQLHYVLATPPDRPGATGIAGDLAVDLDTMHGLLASYQSSGQISGAGDRRLLDAFRDGFAGYVDLSGSFRSLADAGQGVAAGTVIADGAGDRAYRHLKSVIAAWLAGKGEMATAAAGAGRSSYHASVALIVALLVAAMLLALVVAVVLARRITRAVRAIGQAVSAISLGQVIPAVNVSSHDELGELAQNFDGLVAYLSSTIAVAQMIGGGDLDVEVGPAGDHDALGHALVAMTESLRRGERDLRASEENLRAVARLARGLASHENPRRAICEAAREIARADIVQFWEPEAGHTHLHVTAAAGCELSPELRVATSGETSGTAIAFQSRERQVVFDAQAREAPVSIRMRDLFDVASILYEPVTGSEGPLGVLAVIWQTPITQTQDRDIEAVGLLAAEAAVAIERADMTARLQSLARKDGLTGLDNRRVWDEEFPRALRRANRSEDPICVAIADLDRFKSFNDTRGHQAGDGLLRTAAANWRSCLRDDDLLARYGGEEFAIVLQNTTLEVAAGVLDRLRGATPEGQTCSIGLAEWDRTESPDALLARADALVYRAKAAGRNQVMLAAAGE